MPNEDPANLSKDTIPINKLNVRSFIVRPEQSDDLKANQAVEIEGMAFDGGSGIKGVDVSTDGGMTWSPAKLGPDLGNYSFVNSPKRGRHRRRAPTN